VGGPGSGRQKAPGRGPGGELVPMMPDRAPLTSPPRAPRGLSADSRRLWRQLWLNAPWVERGVDDMVIEMVCRGYDDVAAYRERVAADGLMIPGSKEQMVAHPLIAEIRKSLGQLEEWAGYLALRPDMRARLGLTVAKTVSELDDLTERRRKRASGPAARPVVTAEVVTAADPEW
jgi:P27 family predicted phage terminase small subunit